MKVDLVPIGVLFTYDVKGNKERVKFSKKLYGYIDRSNNGKYVYEREGLLSNLSFIKPSESAFIVKKKDSIKVRKFMKEYKASYSEHMIILTSKEAMKMKISQPSKWDMLVEDLKGSEDTLVTVDI